MRVRERRPPREAGPQPEAGKQADVSSLKSKQKKRVLSKEAASVKARAGMIEHQKLQAGPHA